jgi:hypothetical protein
MAGKSAAMMRRPSAHSAWRNPASRAASILDIGFFGRDEQPIDASEVTVDRFLAADRFDAIHGG